MMQPRFANKVVLVTGGSHGIGRAIAERAHAEGATVVINFAHDGEAAAEVVRSLAASGPVGRSQDFSGRVPASACGIQADVSSSREVAELVAAVDRAFGRLDILIASHGVVRRGKLGAITEAMWDEVVDVNLKGVFLVCQAAAPLLAATGQGAIVTISSMRGVEGSASSCHYAAAKAGVIALTRSLALELAPDVRVNGVAPGYVDTRIQSNLTAAERTAIADSTPLHRIGTPAEIAGTALFLASSEAAFITGKTLLVDGGRTRF